MLREMLNRLGAFLKRMEMLGDEYRLQQLPERMRAHSPEHRRRLSAEVARLNRRVHPYRTAPDGTYIWDDAMRGKLLGELLEAWPGRGPVALEEQTYVRVVSALASTFEPPAAPHPHEQESRNADD